MGKKGKFIDKANSQKFHLLHRSLTDEAHANYEVPSSFVLVAANETGPNARGRTTGTKSGAAAKLTAAKDHINELGFANDGYDYSQHLRNIGGGGTFISRTGQTGTALDLATISRVDGPSVELPEDCLPSMKSLDRHLEAITINHDLMDKDIKAALFDGFDEDGEFEELQDDFVALAMEGPEEDDFDFDAHIAKLIARSEQTLGISHKDKGAKGRVHFAGEEDDLEEYGSEDEELPDDLVPEADMQEYRRKLGGRARRAADEEEEGEDRGLVGGRQGAKGAVGALSEEAREALEAQFELALAEYEDEEIGYLEEAGEEDIGGTIDFNEDGNLLEDVLDEFLQAQKDLVFAEGTNLRKGIRSSIVDPKLAGAAAEEAPSAEVDVQKEIQEQQALQEETELELQRMKREAQTKDTSIETCQAYLAEERVEEEWDCESILSTYSTLDNHPTLIKDKNSKFKKYKFPHQRSLDAAAAASSSGGMSSAGSVASRSLASRSKSGSAVASGVYGTSSALTAKVPSSVPGKIVLSGRLNLPEGYGPTTYEKRKDLPQRSLDSAGPTLEDARKGKLVHIAEEAEESGSESESASGEGSGSDGDGREETDERKQSRSGAGKRRQETAEEKKARKDAVKEQRRAKRAGKKELRCAFKAEGARIIRGVGAEQSTDHVSVFKYT